MPHRTRVRERSLMVQTLVRWGGAEAHDLAYKQDHEIEAMADRLKLQIVVQDPEPPQQGGEAA